ncbi:MAG: MerR family transcriptional regulator [Acidobacteriota bacterium]
MAKIASEVPNKLFYKIGEVCELTDTQPYVLRFWESEFPQLSPKKNRSGQRVYQRKDIETVVRIKELLYEEEYTIAGARKKLEEEGTPSRKMARPKPVALEAEHPVDALASGPTRLRKGAPAASQLRSEREIRLEKAVKRLKGMLEELRALLRAR